MKDRKFCFVLFNKSNKMFDDGTGNYVDTLSEAYRYDTKIQANLELEKMDEINKWEIWDCEITIETIYDFICYEGGD